MFAMVATLLHRARFQAVVTRSRAVWKGRFLGNNRFRCVYGQPHKRDRNTGSSAARGRLKAVDPRTVHREGGRPSCNLIMRSSIRLCV